MISVRTQRLFTRYSLILFGAVVMTTCRTVSDAVPVPSPDTVVTTDRVDESEEAAELPADPFGTIPFPDADGGSYDYRLDEQAGLLVRRNDGTWRSAGKGLPGRVLYPFDGTEAPRVTSWNADPLNPRHLALVTPRRLFLSDDAGVEWREIPLEKAVKPSVYLTAVARRGDRILLGTSFSGLYESPDGGRNWRRVADGSIRYRGAGFYEEIAAVAYRPDEAATRLVLYAYGGGLTVLGTDDRPEAAFAVPEGDREWRTLHVDGRDGWYLSSATELRYGRAGTEWTAVGQRTIPADPGRSARKKAASDRRALYLPARKASGQELEDILAFMDRNGMNALVVDMKDDLGRLTYASALPLAAEIGAVSPRIDLAELISRARSRGIWVIGRVVVFKDKALYGHDQGRLALKDRRTGSPWGHKVPEVLADGTETLVQKEFWVDPFSREVWSYNAAIARELQEAGVDEIQFDYIRFPSDGNTSVISSDYRREGMERIDALESFLRVVRETIDAPISTDLYGFNSYYRMGNWIGQDMEMVSRYVDVICPMFYPSHFPRDFLGDMAYIPRAREIYREGTARASDIAGGRSLIRPYVQAFLLSGEFYMDEGQYNLYLVEQLVGAEAGGASGWSLWNNTGRYYMVPEPLTASLSDDEESIPD